MSQNEHDEEIDEADRALLRELLDYHLSQPALPNVTPFRAAHASERGRIDRLQRASLINVLNDRYYLTLPGLRACDSADARKTYERCRELLDELQKAYIEAPQLSWGPERFAHRMERDREEITRLATLLDNSGMVVRLNESTGFAEAFRFHESILDVELPEWVDAPEGDEETVAATSLPQVEELTIDGYRIFAGFTASLGRLTVIVGPNGAGKSSLLDLLRFLSFAAQTPLPPEIDPHSAGKRLFHAGGPEAIAIAAVVNMGGKQPLRYELAVAGPLGAPRVARERLATVRPLSEKQDEPFVFLGFTSGNGTVRDPKERGVKRPPWRLQPNELALRRALDPTLVTISAFQRFVASWRFYSGFDASVNAMARRPVLIEESPVLAEDGSNLSAVLFALMTESPERWDELGTHLRACIQGFASLYVKSRGGKGTVLATFREDGVKDELTLADMSDGSLRLLCWLTLALSPNLPPLICIDEPEVGLHPRALATLAALFKVASARSQILLCTQSPFFLSRFALEDIAVMRKREGNVSLVRGATSQVVTAEFKAWGGEALARMFVSEELEALP